MKNFNFSGTKSQNKLFLFDIALEMVLHHTSRKLANIFGISNMYCSLYHGKPFLCFINNVDKKVDKVHFILFSSMLSFTVSGALDLLY